MFRHVALFAFFALLTGIGVAGGWFAAQQAGHGHHDDHHDDHADEAMHEDEADPSLDPRTLANMGVRIEAVESGPFTRYHNVQAVLVDRPQNVQPVVAPLGGIVTDVHVEVGGVVDAGAPVVTLVRDPIARPKPELTSDILNPISEEVHHAVAKFRSGLGKLEIVDSNLARIRKSRGGTETGGVPVLRKSEIDFENERARLLVEIDAARHELERHGLDKEEIHAVSHHRPAPPNRHLWQHALERSGLWPETSNAIRAKLPKTDRELPWCVVALGELAAAGLVTPALAKALDDEPALAEHFAEASSLLLKGMPLPTLHELARRGALAPRIVVRAPNGVKRWDVDVVRVRPGQHLTAGGSIAELYDARTMWMRLEPVGAEVGMVVKALEGGARMVATPLVRDAGPVLKDVTLRRMDTRTSEGHHAGHAYADVRNELLGTSREKAATSRSWTLRAGTRYLVQVPIEELKNCIVLPSGAVTRRGPDRIVFLQDGKTFRDQVVRVLYEDDKVVVVPNGGGVFAGDPVAVSGAFALQLALDQQGGGDAHHEHGHSHD